MASFLEAFPRLVRHLNYRRTFIARDCLRVDGVTLPYEAFDVTGVKVKPWSLLYLFESVWATAFWNRSRNDESYRTLLDLGDVMDSYFTFVLGFDVTINKSFHAFDAPKHPLHVLTKLKYLGKTSKTISFELYNSNSNALYASADLTDVLVSLSSRKPVPYPEWWLQKNGDLTTAKKAELMQKPNLQSPPLISKVKVMGSNTDIYGHVHFVEYLKFCYDSLFEHAIARSYENIGPEHLDSGVKSFNLVYKKESNLGDILTVRSWESTTKENTVTLEVLKDENLCMYCNIDFYPPPKQACKLVTRLSGEYLVV